MDERYLIRRATAEDASAIYEVERRCFATPWSLRSIEEDLRGNPRAIYLVAETVLVNGAGTGCTDGPGPECISCVNTESGDVGSATGKTDDRTIVGYVSMWLIGEECDINNVSVLPEKRRRGIGDMMIREIIRLTRETGITACTLEVRADNDSAIRLYEKHGFESCGIRPGYYQEDGMDALIMWRTETKEMK